MLEKLTESMGFQKLAESVSKKESNGDRGPAWVIREQLERGYFDMHEPELVEAWRNLGDAQAENLLANVKRIPFRDFFDHKNGRIREFLASSGTDGIAGAYYLIPVKLYTQLQTEAVQADIVTQISKVVLGPEELSPGTTTKIDIMKDGQYKVNETSSGAIAPTETMETLQATLDFSKIYSMNIRLANDLLEDSQFGLLELHVNEAGRQIGEKSSDLALTILATAPDGDGTICSNTSTSQYVMKWIDTGITGLVDLFGDITKNGYVADTLAITHHSMINSVMATTGATANESLMNNNFIVGGFPATIAGMNIVYSDTDYLSCSQAYTLCHAIMFAKQYAMITGRKRWMRIENYSEPVRDLKGAHVTFRQDSVTLYKDAIGNMIEHA
jgi:HK97 family phage major capsid protein